MWPPGANSTLKASLSKVQEGAEVWGVRSQEGSAVISLLCDLRELADPLWASACLQGRGVTTLALISSQGCGEEQTGELLRLCRSQRGDHTPAMPHSYHEHFLRLI